MKTMIRLLILAVLVQAGACFLWADDVKMVQTVTLKSGWNAVYLEVTPDETADETFADWPVERVGVYDPASYLDTKQYSGSDYTEGTSASAYKMWRHGEPAISSLGRVVANRIYVCNNTNATDYVATLYGRPSAPRITWHPSATNEPMNFVGISAVAGASVALGGYFSGLNAGPVSYYRFCGFDETIQLSPVSAGETFADGEVLVASATKVSDWSGVLNVSPLTGLDFSTNLNYRTLTVRNDGAAARTVSVKLDSGDIPAGGTRPIAPEGLLVRESLGQTNAWTAFPAGTVFEKNLAAGETLTLEIALDRTQFSTEAGFYYGGLLKIEDKTEGDDAGHMRVTLPIEVTSDGGAGNTKAWPKGTWIASGEFDTVTYLESTNSAADVKAGGKMPVRLPLYVEYDGKMTLLQRFVHGVDTNGVTHVYSAKVEDKFPVAIGNARRVSSAVLPIEEPAIVSTNGTFGASAEFDFTMGDDAKTNPFRHAFHPSHDGLRWDFETATPSGDDFQNYVSTVKPEIFSIANRITFAWDKSTGSKWTPEEELSGDLTWTLTGLRHEGPIRMKGRFTMKRISDADLDK